MSNSNKFTYIIRSPTTGTTNNFSVRLNGLPNQYKYFDCTTQGFYTKFKFEDATQNGIICELKCFGASILNGRDTNQTLSTIAITATNNDYPSEPFQFRIENFNNQLLNFQLFTESGIQFVTTANGGTAPWILVLNMVGVEDTN